MCAFVSPNPALQVGTGMGQRARPPGEFVHITPASSMDPKELARQLDSSVPMERQRAVASVVRIVGGIDALVYLANKLEYADTRHQAVELLTYRYATVAPLRCVAEESEYADTRSQALEALVSDLYSRMRAQPLAAYAKRRLAFRIAFDVKALVHVAEKSKYADTRFQAADELEKVASKLTNSDHWMSVAGRLKQAANESITAAIKSQAEGAPAGKQEIHGCDSPFVTGLTVILTNTSMH